MSIRTLLSVGAALAAANIAPPTLAGETLDAIRERGSLRCGVNDGLPGFSMADSDGAWSGLDVDICRAVAAAIFGDPDAVDFVPSSSPASIPYLQAGVIDILSHNTTWTLTREASDGLHFAAITLYDGQGFVIPAYQGINSVSGLVGATVCVEDGTTSQLNLAEYNRVNGMKFDVVVVESSAGAFFAYLHGRCDVYTADVSGIASWRASMAPNPAEHVILPEIISKEPLGPAVRQGDDEFLDIVRWVVFALVEAEETGVTQGNVDQMLESTDPTIQRLLGVTDGMGEALGLSESWAYDAIAAVGNYGEIFERNIGPDTPLALDRGLNELWTHGGLMYAMPMR